MELNIGDTVISMRDTNDVHGDFIPKGLHGELIYFIGEDMIEIRTDEGYILCVYIRDFNLGGQ